MDLVNRETRIICPSTGGGMRQSLIAGFCFRLGFPQHTSHDCTASRVPQQRVVHLGFDSFKGSQVPTRSLGLLFVGRFQYNDMGLNSRASHFVLLNERDEPPAIVQTRMAPGPGDCSCSRFQGSGRMWPIFTLDHQLSLLVLPPWHPQHSHSLCCLCKWELRASPDALRHFCASKRNLQQGDASHAW